MKMLDIFSLTSGLASVHRFSTVRLLRRESVLEHTGMVVLFCYFLGNHFKVNLGQLLSKATVHDFDEFITGDISRPTKYSSEDMRNRFGELEKNGMSKLSALLANGKLFEDYVSAKQDFDGKIVAFADLAAVVYKVWDEVLLQNNYLMVRQAINIRNYLRSFMEKNPEFSIFGFELMLILDKACALEQPYHRTIREEELI